jgi:hypothetical protein
VRKIRIPVNTSLTAEEHTAFSEKLAAHNETAYAFLRKKILNYIKKK